MKVSAHTHTVRRVAVLASVVVAGAAAQAQSLDDANGPKRYTEVRQEPALAPGLDASRGNRVEAVHWTRHGRHQFGLALGMSVTPSNVVGTTDQVQPGVGLRWRSQVGSRRIDVATWRDVSGSATAGADARPLTTRIEMQFKPRSQSIAAEFGAVGMQLNSNTKLQLKIRKGGPVVYYRSKF